MKWKKEKMNDSQLSLKLFTDKKQRLSNKNLTKHLVELIHQTKKSSLNLQFYNLINFSL